MIIETERLILRQWCEEDFDSFARLNADPRVREFFPSVLTKSESDASAEKFQRDIEKNGWGLWAVTAKNVAPFIGFIGLNTLDYDLPLHTPPLVEIGWRLAFDYWGRGYATEGAMAALKYGFNTLKLPEIVSVAVVQNIRSISVMKKIGMSENPSERFDHPRLPKGHPLRKHVLYCIKMNQWEKITNSPKASNPNK